MREYKTLCIDMSIGRNGGLDDHGPSYVRILLHPCFAERFLVQSSPP